MSPPNACFKISAFVTYFFVFKKNNMAVSQQLDLNPTCDQAELRQRIYFTNNLQISYYVMIDVFIVVSLGAYQNCHVMTINH